MVPIARRNLLADKVKLLVAVGGVTLAIVLIIVVHSLYQGVRRETDTFIHSLPGHENPQVDEGWGPRRVAGPRRSAARRVLVRVTWRGRRH